MSAQYKDSPLIGKTQTERGVLPKERTPVSESFMQTAASLPFQFSPEDHTLTEELFFMTKGICTCHHQVPDQQDSQQSSSLALEPLSLRMRDAGSVQSAVRGQGQGR